MSVPNRSEDGIDDPLLYAPRWCRSKPIAPEQSISTHAPSTAPVITSGATPRITNAPPMAPGIGGYNIDMPPPKARPFQGDVAIKDMRRQQSLDPQSVPEPPVQKERKPLARWHGWLSCVAIVAVIIGLAVLLMTFLDEARKAGGIADKATPPREGLPDVGTLLRRTRLVVESQTGSANEPLPLGVSLNYASGDETVTLAGFAKGTQLSAGKSLGPTRWRMSAHELVKAIAYSPKDFVGVMEVAIDLRSGSDQPLDSQVVRLEWVEKREQHSTPQPDTSKPPTVIQLDPEAIAILEQFLKNGDILSARLLLKRAATTGNAQAALELGMTFDPLFLTERGVIGFTLDIAQARVWYERAAQLGSTEALRLLERLANIGR
jgi:hypothetical protein